MDSKRLRVDQSAPLVFLPFLPKALELVIAHSQQRLVWALPHTTQPIINMLLSSPRTNMEKATQENLPNIVRWLAQNTTEERLQSGMSAPEEYRELRFLVGVFDSAKLGSIELIQAWFTYFPEAEDLATPKIFEVAVREGHIHLLQWLLDQGKLKDKTMISTAFNSRANVIEWLRERFPSLKLTISIDQMVEQWTGPDALAFMKDIWKRKRQFKKIKLTLHAKSMAACRGDLEMLEWIDTVKKGDCHWWAVIVAADHGHVETFQWLKEHFHYRGGYTVIQEAARLGHLGILKLRPDDIDPQVTSLAVGNGHLEVLKWLDAEKKLASREVKPWLAAYDGHLEVLQWLHEHGYKCKARAFDSAAGQGHLHVIQWLHSYGIRGSGGAMDYAAGTNRLDIIQWLHSNGYGCTRGAMDVAASHGCLDIVIWLHANRTEGCSSKAMRLAAINGHLHVVQWLHENRPEAGCGGHTICHAVLKGHYEMAQWLHSHNLGICDCALMKRAVKGGSLALVKWVHANRPEDTSDTVLSPAIKRGHLEIAKWLIANRLGKIREKDMEKAALMNQLLMAKWLYATSPGQFSWYTFGDEVLRELYRDPMCADFVEWLLAKYPRAVSSSEATSKLSEWTGYPRYPPDVVSAKQPRRDPPRQLHWPRW